MIPPPRPRQEDNIDSWLMSYADMITLLLAFFIIFVSISTPKADKLAAATRGMKEKFGVLEFESPFDGTYRSIVGIVATNHADSNIAVEKTTQGIEIELAALPFFDPGSARIPVAQLPMLLDIARSLKQAALAEYHINVESYTSDAPPGSGFASNWELSSARAVAVVKLLQSAGVNPARLEASSFAEAMPQVPNEDARGQPIAENRQRNQRVVIKVEKNNPY